MLEIFPKVKEVIVARDIELKSVLAAMDAGKHILLEGPPGTSKSTLLRNIAQMANIPFYIVEGNIDLTPAKLVGNFNPAKVMADSYLPEYFEKGPLTKAMEEGGILYIEEFNRMPADVSNVLITPMEEGEMHIPRYGTVQAIRPFTIIAAQNPYDDVGTVRVSRAFMDRICLIKMDYQTEQDERGIVLLRSCSKNHRVIEAAVKMVRKTREHHEIKLGASVRAAIDLVDIFHSLQKIGDQSSDQDFMSAARMALSNKIWLNEITGKSADEILEDIWESIKVPYKDMTNASKEELDVSGSVSSTKEETTENKEENQAGKKKR